MQRPKNTIATKLFSHSLAFAALVGLSACAGEANNTGEEVEFDDDSQIVLAEEANGASDSGRDIFANIRGELATGFELHNPNQFYKRDGDYLRKVEFAFYASQVAIEDGSWTRVPAQARFRVITVPFATASDNTTHRIETLFETYDAQFTFVDGAFVAEVNGHRITVREQESPDSEFAGAKTLALHIDWAPGVSSDVLAAGTDFTGISEYGVGVRVSAALSGRLWNSVEGPIQRTARQDTWGVLIEESKKMFTRQITTENFALQCYAERALFGILPYAKKSCGMSIVGSIVSGNAQAYGVQTVIEGSDAQRVWDFLGGDEDYRGFLSDKGSLGCGRNETSREVVCVAQVGVAPY